MAAAMSKRMPASRAAASRDVSKAMGVSRAGKPGGRVASRVKWAAGALAGSRGAAAVAMSRGAAAEAISGRHGAAATTGGSRPMEASWRRASLSVAATTMVPQPWRLKRARAWAWAPRGGGPRVAQMSGHGQLGTEHRRAAHGSLPVGATGGRRLLWSKRAAAGRESASARGRSRRACERLGWASESARQSWPAVSAHDTLCIIAVSSIHSACSLWALPRRTHSGHSLRLSDTVCLCMRSPGGRGHRIPIATAATAPPPPPPPPPLQPPPPAASAAPSRPGAAAQGNTR